MKRVIKSSGLMAIVILIVTCMVSHADVIFSDAFQEVVFADGTLGRVGSIHRWGEGWNENNNHSDQAGAEDNHSVVMACYGDGSNFFYRTVNTILYSDITIEVKAFQTGTVNANPTHDKARILVDTGDGFAVLLEDTGIWDGAGTNETSGLQTTSLSTGEIALPASAANSTGLVVRIENEGDNARSFYIDSVIIRGTPLTTEVLFLDVFQIAPKAVGSTGRAGYNNGWTNAWTVVEDDWGGAQFFYINHASAVDGHAMRVKSTTDADGQYPSAERTISTLGFSDIAIKMSEFQSGGKVSTDYVAIQVDTGSGFVTLLEDKSRWDGEGLIEGNNTAQETPVFTPFWISLGAVADNNSSVKIKLQWHLVNADTEYVDSIEVRGIAIPPSGTVITIN